MAAIYLLTNQKKVCIEYGSKLRIDLAVSRIASTWGEERR
jgi:hypothetical protein